MSIRSIILCFLFLFSITVLTESCKKGCKACDYGESCNANAGSCFCPNGLEGDSCLTYSYLKYLHNYYVTDPCSGNSNYSVYIQNDPTYASKLYIYNLFGYQVEADIYSNSSKQGINLNIPDQVLGAIEVSGTGIYQVYNGYARITLQIDYVTGGTPSQCTVILNQQ